MLLQDEENSNMKYIGFMFPILESSCHFSLSASIFLIITITIERWQAVCFPFAYQASNQQYNTNGFVMDVMKAFSFRKLYFIFSLCFILRQMYCTVMYTKCH